MDVNRLVECECWWSGRLLVSKLYVDVPANCMWMYLPNLNFFLSNYPPISIPYSFLKLDAFYNNLL